MHELKVVKHALKKMLRLSRQLILENEYYQVLDLVNVPNDAGTLQASSKNGGENEDDKQTTQDGPVVQDESAQGSIYGSG